MVVLTSRRSFMGSMAATATAAALLPVLAIARDADRGSEGLAYRTAGDLVKAIAGRQVSSRELVDSAISRIEAVDPKINAVVVRDFDRARIAADAALIADLECRADLGGQSQTPADHIPEGTRAERRGIGLDAAVNH